MLIVLWNNLVEKLVNLAWPAATPPCRGVEPGIRARTQLSPSHTLHSSVYGLAPSHNTQI